MHLLGQVGGAADSDKATALATLFSAVASKVNASESNHKFRCVAIEAPNVADTSSGDAALALTMASLANPRIAIGYGFADITGALNLRTAKRSAAWEMVARARVVAPNRDPAAVEDGALPVATKSGSLVGIYHDESKRPGPGAARYSTLRTFDDFTGFYCTNFFMFSAAGSDYRFLMHRRVIDIVARSARAVALRQLGRQVRTYPGIPGQPSTFDPTRIAGTIFEDDAVTLEGLFNAALERDVVIPGYAFASSSEINRTDIIQTTADLRYKTRTRMGVYLKSIEVEHGFAP
jgi:hypothetical protein